MKRNCYNSKADFYTDYVKRRRFVVHALAGHTKYILVCFTLTQLRFYCELFYSAHSVQRLGYELNGPMVESRKGKKFLLQTGSGTQQASNSMVDGTVVPEQSGRGVMLSTHLPLMSR